MGGDHSRKLSLGGVTASPGHLLLSTGQATTFLSYRLSLFSICFWVLALRGCDLRHCLHPGRPIGTETRRARVDHDRSNSRHSILCPIHGLNFLVYFKCSMQWLSPNGYSAERQINTTEENKTLLKRWNEVYHSSLWNDQIGRLSLHYSYRKFSRCQPPWLREAEQQLVPPIPLGYSSVESSHTLICPPPIQSSVPSIYTFLKYDRTA
jgi:hypothetical protein